MATPVVSSERIMVYWDKFNVVIHWICRETLCGFIYSRSPLDSRRLPTAMLICIWAIFFNPPPGFAAHATEITGDKYSFSVEMGALQMANVGRRWVNY